MVERGPSLPDGRCRRHRSVRFPTLCGVRIARPTALAAALAALAAATIPLAGCADQEKARAGAALEAYINDYASGNVRSACDRLTPGARAAFRVRVGQVVYRPCVPAISAQLRAYQPNWVPRFRALEVTSVDVHGDRATAVTAPDSLVGGAPTPLRKVGGRWLIAAPADLRLVQTPPDNGF